jgi:F-type H+-transporting ATPase subunit epsilon
MNTFKIELASPENNLVFDKVISISVNGLDGKIMILANHAPYMVYISPGTIVIKMDNEPEKQITVGTGILEVANNYCNIIINNFST